MPRKPPRSTEERLVRAQKSMMPGTLGGRVASAAPMTIDSSRLDPRLRADPPTPRTHRYTRLGEVTAAAGAVPMHNDTRSSLNVTSVRVIVGTAPSTDDVMVDVTIDGASVFDGVTFPTVAAGTTVGDPVVPTAGRWPPGAAMLVDVTQGDADATDLHVTIVVA